MKTWRLGLFGAATITLAAAQVNADWIAYQAKVGGEARTIVIMTEYGTRPVTMPTPPGAGGGPMTPSLSSDGKAVAFAARVGQAYKIFVWDLDAFAATVGSPRQLTSGDSHDEQPAWSPDGKKIAFLSMKGTEYGLFVVDAQGGEPVKVASLTLRFRQASPTWAPDSQRIAFSLDGDLMVASLQGGAPQRLGQKGWYPAWSPDGAHIAAFMRQPLAELALIDSSGKLETTLARDVASPGQIAWSPDGKRILFKAAKVGSASGSLWRVDAQGGEVTSMRAHGQVHGYVSWSRSASVHVAEAPAAPAPPVAQRPPAPAAPPRPLPVAAPARRAASPAPPRSTPARTAAATPPKPLAVVAPPPVLPVPAAQDAVRIVTPADGSTLRQAIRVVANKKNPDGYLVFQVDGAFQYASASPFEWKWDTRTIWRGEADVPTTDKEYTITVLAYSPAGVREGIAQAKVTLQNGIAPSALGEHGTPLRLRFVPEQMRSRRIEADSRFQGTGGADVPQWTRSLECRLEGTLEQEAESVTRDGTTAALVTRLGQGTRLTIGGVITPMPETARSARTTALYTGPITASQAAAGQHRISLGEIYLKLPQGPSRVQDSWTSPITFVADLNTRQLYEAAANHKIEELKWMQDIEALRIRSYATLPAVITLPQNITLTGISVTRDTWFAYKERRILRIEDTITAQAQVPVAAIGSSAAIPTMPQFPGPGLPAPRAGNAAEEEFAFQGGNPGLRFEPSGASAERLREETFQRRRPFGGFAGPSGVPSPYTPGQPAQPTTPTSPYGVTQYKNVKYLMTLAIYDAPK